MDQIKKVKMHFCLIQEKIHVGENYFESKWYKQAYIYKDKIIIWV